MYQLIRASALIALLWLSSVGSARLIGRLGAEEWNPEQVAAQRAAERAAEVRAIQATSSKDFTLTATPVIAIEGGPVVMHLKLAYHGKATLQVYNPLRMWGAIGGRDIHQMPLFPIETPNGWTRYFPATHAFVEIIDGHFGPGQERIAPEQTLETDIHLHHYFKDIPAGAATVKFALPMGRPWTSEEYTPERKAVYNKIDGEIFDPNYYQVAWEPLAGQVEIMVEPKDSPAAQAFRERFAKEVAAFHGKAVDIQVLEGAARNAAIQANAAASTTAERLASAILYTDSPALWDQAMPLLLHTKSVDFSMRHLLLAEIARRATEDAVLRKAYLGYVVKSHIWYDGFSLSAWGKYGKGAQGKLYQPTAEEMALIKGAHLVSARATAADVWPEAFTAEEKAAIVTAQKTAVTWECVEWADEGP